MQRLSAENYAVDADDDIRFVLGIVIMGSISGIEEWVNSDCNKPIKTLAILMYNLITYGLTGLHK